MKALGTILLVVLFLVVLSYKTPAMIYYGGANFVGTLQPQPTPSPPPPPTGSTFTGQLGTDQSQLGNIMLGVVSPQASSTPPPNPNCITYQDNSRLNTFGLGVSTVPVGQACAAQMIAAGGPGGCPLPTNGHDPYNYSYVNGAPQAGGADITGTNDDDLSVNGAAQAGTDVVFGTPGTYLINMTHAGTGIIATAGLEVGANAKVLCTAFNSDGSPAVHLKNTNNNDLATFYASNGGNTFCGCDFVGSDPVTYTSGAGANSNTAILIHSNNITVEGNTAHGIHGDVVFGTDSNPGAPQAGWTIRYNTTEHNGYYSINVDGSNSGTINNNLSYGDTLAMEYDSCTNASGAWTRNVVWQYNYLHYRTTPGVVALGTLPTSYMGAWYPNTASGASVNCDYSTDIFSDNMCDATANFNSSTPLWVTANGLPCANRALYGTNAGSTYLNNHYSANCPIYSGNGATCAGHDLNGVVTP